MKLLFPDPIWHPSMLSGAGFLYFNKEKLALTLHPSVSSFLTGIDVFDFMRYVQERKPSWHASFAQFTEMWRRYRGVLQETSAMMAPLHEYSYKSLWLVYNKDDGAFEKSRTIIESTGLKIQSVRKLIDPYVASDELFAHIFFEKCLELYPEAHSSEAALKMSRNQKPTFLKVDWKPLYEYCEGFFGSTELDELLTLAYLFRIPALKATDSLMLTNQNLLGFLEALPVEFTKTSHTSSELGLQMDLDVVAWEFFRQVLSPRMDPINQDIVKSLVRLIKDHSEEIEKLRSKCLSLALDFKGEKDLAKLQEIVSQHVRAKVEPDVKALLELDDKSVGELMSLVFSDEKTWMTLSAFVFSLLNGNSLLTGGAALAAMCNVGAKAFKVASQTRKFIKQNDYVLIYRLKGD